MKKKSSGLKKEWNQTLTSEVNYIATFQAIDMDVNKGTHRYQVTVENMTNGTEAAVVGPISFSGLAIAPSEEDHHKDDSPKICLY